MLHTPVPRRGGPGGLFHARPPAYYTGGFRARWRTCRASMSAGSALSVRTAAGALQGTLAKGGLPGALNMLAGGLPSVRPARSCCGCAGNSIVEWFFMCSSSSVGAQPAEGAQVLPSIIHPAALGRRHLAPRSEL